MSCRANCVSGQLGKLNGWALGACSCPLTCRDGLVIVHAKNVHKTCSLDFCQVSYDDVLLGVRSTLLYACLMDLDVWWQLGLFATIARRARVGSRNLWRTVTATAKVTIAAIVASVIAAIAFTTIIASCERLGLLEVVGLVGFVCFLILAQLRQRQALLG